MIELKIKVTNTMGIHARPAAQIVKTASKFESSITLEKEGGAISADAKSIMSILMLAAACGSTVIIRASGKDEQKAVEAIAALFKNKFNEDNQP